VLTWDNFALKETSAVTTLAVMRADNVFQISEIVLWTIIGFGLVGMNVIFAHKLAEMYDKRQRNKN